MNPPVSCPLEPTANPPVQLAVDLAGLRLRNPVMPASGTFGYGEEFAPYVDLETLGAIVTKGISLRPKAGNPTPRLAETASGMLNAIGLQNVGVEAFARDKVPFLRQLQTPVIVNFFGNSLDEYEQVAARLADIDRVDAVELNISCPNVKQGGIVFGTDPAAAAEVVGRVRRHLRVPLIVKLTPNVTDIGLMARAVEDAGADAISCINTLTGMAVDLQRRRLHLANKTGGLSGPAIKPVALRLVYQAVRSVSIPVIGIGGIASAEDALEFLLVGARAVQVGTANLVNPAVMGQIVSAMEAFCRERNIGDINDWIGSLQEE
ncbi:MAG: dihydroorotate dehydrogenase [Desulfuromonas thiophila]|jgi:dihydroorotate dehydrogenase (NAD+) catalytic subunit|nr:dihydroorotate dehydrogenase [Desulfuromonas thiophila]